MSPARPRPKRNLRDDGWWEGYDAAMSLSEVGWLITAWATGKTPKVMVSGEWRDMTPDTLKAKAGDEWVTLREAIRRFDERSSSD